jgi:hypothetical protein
MFILADQRDSDAEGAFARYRDYLEKNRHRFPSSALALATSDWYFGFTSHQAPHDSWLESVQVFEPSSGERSELRTTSIRIRLLGAYHDGYIEFYYPMVSEYSLTADTLGQGTVIGGMTSFGWMRRDGLFMKSSGLRMAPLALGL